MSLIVPGRRVPAYLLGGDVGAALQRKRCGGTGLQRTGFVVRFRPGQGERLEPVLQLAIGADRQVRVLVAHAEQRDTQLAAEEANKVQNSRRTSSRPARILCISPMIRTRTPTARRSPSVACSSSARLGASVLPLGLRGEVEAGHRGVGGHLHGQDRDLLPVRCEIGGCTSRNFSMIIDSPSFIGPIGSRFGIRCLPRPPVGRLQSLQRSRGPRSADPPVRAHAAAVRHLATWLAAGRSDARAICITFVEQG